MNAVTPLVLMKQEPYDPDAVWAALPPPSRVNTPGTDKGAAGHRLSGHLRSTIPERLLLDFAKEELGALRLNTGYAEALRVVLGNQARAERGGYTLEQNIRVDFATERTMRTINGQMAAAGITRGRRITLGNSRAQTVQCFERRPMRATGDLETRYRLDEAMGSNLPPRARVPHGITGADVPY